MQADHLQVTHNHPSGTAHGSARRGSVAGVATVRGPSSPRKSIPSQWLPSNSGPNLATARRAKDRGNKKGSVHGSPIDTKTLGSTRSMTDLNRAHAADGASFLTKTAHTPVESDLAVSPTARSPTKQHCTSSKSAWNSPTRSPLRDSPHQQPHLIIRTSPVKTTFLDASVDSQRHRRANSQATSTGDTVYHSADSSPVRGSDDTESYSETFEHVSEIQSSANNEHEQASTSYSLPQTTSITAVAGTSTKPSLRIQIPETRPSIPSDEKSSEACSSPTSSGPWSSTSASSISRIPRAAGTHSISARGPTLSSTLKRVQPSKSLTSLKAKPDVQGKTTVATKMEALPSTSVRHAHFADARGATQVWTKHPGIDLPSSSTHTPVSADVSPLSARSGSDLGEDAATMLEQANFSKPVSDCSRASSLSTVKAAPSHRDPVLVDPAVVYSKKLGASGTTLDQPLNVPHIIVMMAHNTQTGSFSNTDQLQNAPGGATSVAYANLGDASPARGRTAQFVPTSRRQAESSEHSLTSSLSSDLRATAPEFVPYSSTSAQQETPSVPAPRQAEAPSQQLDPTTDLLGDMKWELDMHGIPWFYYMYQVQIAYNEGFQKGRNKSPKKTRQKKNNPRTSGQSHSEAEKYASSSSSIPPPAFTVPLAEHRAQKLSEVSVEGSPDLYTDTTKSANDSPSTPFRAQNELIDRQNAFRDIMITERPLPGIDLTTIRNVPEGPLPHGAFNTLQHRGPANQPRRFNNRSDNGLYTYRGRGLPGLRMQDTVPFPAPMPPPGRPTSSAARNNSCGVVEIMYAAENVGGMACYKCEPDHPLD